MLERCEFTYRGRVQGVGFREQTRRLAASFQVAGYVQNLPDRSVRLVVEGEVAEVFAFVAAVQTAMADYIYSCEQTCSPSRGEESGFSIRR